jgi:hypothetical protein
VRQFEEAVEKSGKPLATDTFLMALLQAQQRMISQLRSELEKLGVRELERSSPSQLQLDAFASDPQVPFEAGEHRGDLPEGPVV